MYPEDHVLQLKHKVNELKRRLGDTTRYHAQEVAPRDDRIDGRVV